MRFLSTTIALLAFGILAISGHLVHNGHEHGHHHEAVSYSQVTKHEDQGHTHHEHHGHEHGHSHGHEAVSYSQVTKHEDQGHNHHHEHHGHQEHHVEHHQGHHEHHVEHHGNNGHDDHHHGHHDEHHGHAKYEFKYGVKDPKTGDIKEQWESRDGDSVKGGYTLKESDGTTRLVKYTSDKKKGFEATVHKIGHAHHEQGHYGHH